VLVSACNNPAINIPDGAGDPGGFAREQEVDDTANILWLANTANRVKAINGRQGFRDFIFFDE
jgi:hypothetical protein